MADHLKHTLKEIFRRRSVIFGPGVLFAYVFGSTGTAGQNEHSDLDIAVYLDMDAHAFELEHKLALYTEISRAVKRNDIDLVILNVFNNQVLLYQILTKGELIYDADPAARAIFEQKALHAAIDFKQRRERIFG